MKFKRITVNSKLICCQKPGGSWVKPAGTTNGTLHSTKKSTLWTTKWRTKPLETKWRAQPLEVVPKKATWNKTKPKDQTQWPSTPSMMYPAFVLVTRIVTPKVNSSFTKKHHSSSHSWPSFYSSTIDLYLCIHWFILPDMFYYYSIQNIPKPLCNHAATWQQYQISAPISAPQYIHIHINMYVYM